MAGNVTVEYNRPSKPEFEQLATNPSLVIALHATALRGQVHAVALAAEFSKTGHYAESFEIQEDTETVRGTKRAVALLVNTAAYAARVEDGEIVTVKSGPRKGKAKRGKGGDFVRSGEGHHVLGRVKDLLEAAE